jgi:lipopolysaccharide export system permease protein
LTARRRLPKAWGQLMSVLTRYVFKEHLGPFFFSLATIVFVFVLNIVFRDLGRLLGKGISAGVILEFFGLNLAWILALAIPMSILVATLMGFGRLSSDNEITALKASGIHIVRIVWPVILAACVLSFLMERFNNCVLPDFNHRVRMLYADISRKRPTLTLEPNVFFNDIPKYTLLIQKVNSRTNEIHGIVVNDYTDPKFDKTIFAQRGRIEFSEEREKMQLVLEDGEIHEVEIGRLENYRRMQFQQQILSVSISDMVLKRSNTEYRGDREKSASRMKRDIEQNRKVLVETENRIRTMVQKDLGFWMSDSLAVRGWQSLSPAEKPPGTAGLFSMIQQQTRLIRGYKRSNCSLWVEVHKKYSIPFACVVFALIGAPVGIMARQGGWALGSGLSLFFFLLYWTFLIGGEGLADRQIIPPAVAMWSPNVLVGAFGVYLMIRTVRETTFLRWDRIKEFFRKKRGGRL